MKLIMKKLFIVYAVIIFFAAFTVQFTGRINWRMGPSLTRGYADGYEFGYPVSIFYAPIEIEKNTGDTPIRDPLSLRIFSTGSYTNPGVQYLSHGPFMWEQRKWDHTRWGPSYKIVSSFGIGNINIPEEINPSFTSCVPGLIANIFYVVFILVCLLYLYYSGMVRRHDVFWISFFILACVWLIFILVMYIMDFSSDFTYRFFEPVNWFVELLMLINATGKVMIYFCVLEWLYLGAKYLFQRLFFRKSRVHGLETSSR